MFALQLGPPAHFAKRCFSLLLFFYALTDARISKLDLLLKLDKINKQIMFKICHCFPKRKFWEYLGACIGFKLGFFSVNSGTISLLLKARAGRL